jgi:aspartyl-tRNA(Asn)/glutamyl-tRNA(Gln) amidotransferase subunit A
MVPLSLGTQTAGSVSRPAAYCGIAAFKPSTQSWPTFGIVPFAPSFDTAGVFGYRTADATAAARILMPTFLQGAQRLREGRVVVGMVEDPILEDASEAVCESLRSAAEKLAGSGIHVRPYRSPVGFADIIAWHKTVTEFELGRAHGSLLAAPADVVTPALREAVERGRRIDERGYHDALHALAAAKAEFWQGSVDCDSLICPTAPDIAPIGMKTGDPRYIIPLTALGGPIVSIPVAYDRGMPLGLMLIGPPGADAALADIADRCAPLIETTR